VRVAAVNPWGSEMKLIRRVMVAVALAVVAVPALSQTVAVVSPVAAGRVPAAQEVTWP